MAILPRPVAGWVLALLGAVAAAGCHDPSPPVTHVFYLHGQIVEEQGRRGTHPKHGTYEYDAILKALARPGFVVHSEARPKGTDPAIYAGKVAAEVERLLAQGVPGRRITVIGASKGAVIAMLVSTRLASPASPEVGYVVLGNCNGWVLENFRVDLHGEVLSLYDASDEFGETCQPAFEQSKQIGAHREIRLDTGLGHGFLYRPMDEWVGPAVAWAQERRVP